MEDQCVIFRCCELDCQLEAVRDDGRMLWWCHARDFQVSQASALRRRIEGTRKSGLKQT